MTEFFALPLAAIFVVSAALVTLALEAGRSLGRRERSRGGDDITTLEAAILGLLALIIGFTVAISISRYDARRDAILDEANAIGTVALRATLLPEPHGDSMIALLADYAKLRQSITNSIDQPDLLQDIERESNAILDKLWAETKSVLKENDSMVPTGLFIESLNSLIDDQEKRLAALNGRVPRIVLATMYVIAIVAAGFIGYGAGLRAHRRRWPGYLMSFLVIAVILLIQDLDRPDSGFILVSQTPLIDAATLVESLGARP